MLEITFFNVETQEKGVVVCDELTGHRLNAEGFAGSIATVMCCDVEQVKGVIDPINYYQLDYETHIVLLAQHFSSAISLD